MSLSLKKVIILSVAALLCVAVGLIFRITVYDSSDSPKDSQGEVGLTLPEIDCNGVTLEFRAEGDYFYCHDGENWSAIYLNGVNMGLTEATTDLANPDVSYDTYREWLLLIAEMNANTVRVFTVMPPQFYTALYDHNTAADEPLYLIQGIWFNENYMYEYDNAFSEDGIILEAFRRAAKETSDIIHGNSDYTDYGEIKNAVYAHDVSLWLAGYILGLEWDPGFVERTNAQSALAGYGGEYLKTSDEATAFESFLCAAGDYLAEYETVTYSFQTPIAFLNWATTDTLTHTNEPFEEEDRVSVDTENILPTDKYYCGLFAAVDVYPYYPEFINYQPEYLEPDSDGNIDPYRAYLRELRGEYSVPVIIAEYGVPSSRGSAHTSVSGFDQGGITEEEQGEAIVSMMESIAGEKYAGSLIFSWQDEWFKQTWNTVRYFPDDADTRTPNVQSAEQSYGLLAMEAGEETICLIDGDADDWEGIVPIAQSGGNRLSVQWDEAYLYLKVETRLAFGEDTILVPISISGRGSSFSSEYDVTFSGAVDFLLVIKGEKDTRLLTDSYQDVFYYTYAYQNGVFERDSRFEVSGGGLYTPIRQFLSNEIVLPLTGEVINPRFTESGLLTYGISDSESKEYNSLADFYYKDGTLEIRIPWYLLNVMNSTEGVCLDDFYQSGGVETIHIQSIDIGIGIPGDDNINLSDTGYSTKEYSSFHTRLKKSYYIVKTAMENLIWQSEYRRGG